MKESSDSKFESKLKAQYWHPMWQKKRLEQLSVVDFTCMKCDNKESTLHVHHDYYVAGRDIWAYPDFCFSVLCNKCHRKAHARNMKSGPSLWERYVDILTLPGLDTVVDDMLKLAKAYGKPVEEMPYYVSKLLRNPAALKLLAEGIPA